MVALVHILVVDLATWLFVFPMPPLALFVLPVSLAYMAIGAIIAKGPGKLGQAGRGMLIGSLSGPLSLIIFIPAFYHRPGEIGPI